MANSLINGTEGAMAPSDPPAAEPDPNVVPTWGYRHPGLARIFDLQPGEKLPAGWYDSPDRVPAREPKKSAEPQT